MVKSAPPSNLAAYVEILGEDLAIEFFLQFGGAPVYLAENPKSRSAVATLVGHSNASALAERLGAGHLRVPIDKRWLAQRLHARGEAVVAIARRLHVADVSVRRYLKAEDSAQLTLFN